jgi:hypothetical protein
MNMNLIIPKSQRPLNFIFHIQLLECYSVATIFSQLFRRAKKQVISETILMIAQILYIHVNNNKTDLLPKFESLKCNSFVFIQNIILL